MRVLFIDSVHAVLQERLEKMGFSCEHDYTSNRETIIEKLSDFDGIVIRSRIKIDEEFLSAAKHLKFIARSGAGLENIDIDSANKRDIQLFSAPEGNRQAVGEHTLGMLLSLFNRLSIADEEIRSGKWQREANRGLELSGKTVGIIGYGNMGKAFAKCLSGFDCKVLAHSLETDTSDEYAAESTLENIQDNADIISFHTPYDKSTHHYLDEAFVANMKKPFFVINTARGKVVKTKALVEGLQSKQILGACLDVLEYEKASFENLFENEMPKDFDYLIRSQKVLLSPHVAGWSHESYEKLSAVLADKIEKAFGG
jgi:phosphoglycerate dehydrogenase-like enzyme